MLYPLNVGDLGVVAAPRFRNGRAAEATQPRAGDGPHPGLGAGRGAVVAYMLAGSPCMMLPLTGGVEKVRQTKFHENGSRRFQGRSDRERARRQ